MFTIRIIIPLYTIFSICLYPLKGSLILFFLYKYAILNDFWFFCIYFFVVLQKTLSAPFHLTHPSNSMTFLSGKSERKFCIYAHFLHGYAPNWALESHSKLFLQLKMGVYRKTRPYPQFFNFVGMDVFFLRYVQKLNLY